MTIPVVFAIDNNVVVPCAVTITSLLKNALPDTQYDIHILYDRDRLQLENRTAICDAFAGNPKCRISFIRADDIFNLSDELISGHLTTAGFYRLGIPSLFPQFDRVIYSDVDIIFQQDLSDVYSNTLKNDELVAAVLDLAIDKEFFFDSDLPSQIGKSVQDYFNSGFMVMNLKEMRNKGIETEFKRLIKEKFEQNDQDILNIVCSGRVDYLPSLYNFQLNHFSNYMWGREDVRISFDELFKKGTLHYTWKNKPWNSLECVGCDTWWHYYKLSPFFDVIVYFERQKDQLEVCRNDYHKKTNMQLIKRLLANLKHKLLK